MLEHQKTAIPQKPLRGMILLQTLSTIVEFDVVLIPQSWNRMKKVVLRLKRPQ